MRLSLYNELMVGAATCRHGSSPMSVWCMCSVASLLLQLSLCTLAAPAARRAASTKRRPQAATSAPTRTPRPTLAPEPSPTLVPPILVPTEPAIDFPLATMTAELSATVVASLPPTPTPDQANGTGGFGLEGVSAQALRAPQAGRSCGRSPRTACSVSDPSQAHFVAIYTHDGGDWKQLDRFELTDDDYLDPTGLAQVDIDPKNIWLEAQGGAGAHSGCYDLLRFDGKQLHSEVSSCSSSPGDSRLEDVNGDGTPEVVLDATDYYVFCYACGVRQDQLHRDALGWPKDGRGQAGAAAGRGGRAARSNQSGDRAGAGRPVERCPGDRSARHCCYSRQSGREMGRRADRPDRRGARRAGPERRVPAAGQHVLWRLPGSAGYHARIHSG